MTHKHTFGLRDEHDNPTLFECGCGAQLTLWHYLQQVASLQAALDEAQARNSLFERCLDRALKLWRKENPEVDIWPSVDKNIADFFEEFYGDARKVMETDNVIEMRQKARDWLAKYPKETA